MDSISNEANWNLIYDNRIEDRENPLSPIDLNQEFYQHTIRVTVTADKIPNNWIRAGWLYHRLNTDTTTPFVVEIVEVGVNVKQLIKLEPLTLKFYLSFRPMFRFLWMNVKIEFYSQL